MDAMIGVLLIAFRWAGYVFLLRCVVVYSYRVLLHPLRKYPGPSIAKLSDWYGAFHAICYRLHLVTYQDHQKYGPVIRHGPNKLVFNTVTALNDIYHNERLLKARAYLVTTLEPGIYSVFNAIDKNVHRQKRKVVGKGISEQSMRRFEPTILSHIDIFLQQLEESAKSAEAVNMTDRCKRLGSDIISQLGFGRSLNMQTDEKNRFIAKGLEFGNHRVNIYIQFPMLEWISPEILLSPLLRVLEAKYFHTLQGLIKQRLAEGTHEKEDLISFVAEAQGDDLGTRMSEVDLWTEGIFLFPAGSDTTSACLSAAFFYLSRSPSSYEKLASEIRTTFSTGADIRSGPTLASCSYLRAVLDETLRISPPVPGTLWRELAPDDNVEPLVIDGHVVPHGTLVGVNTYSIHHNPDYFPSPFVFKPERWLEPSKDKDGTTSSGHIVHEAFTAFSHGARGCAGKAMAYMEASLTLAKTIWYFDFKLPDGPSAAVGGGVAGKRNGRGRPEEYQLYDVFSSGHDGPNLVFRARKEL